MEFRRKEEEEEQSSQPSSKAFTPLTLPSAFSKPLLPSSSSLLTPKSSKEPTTGSRNGTIGSSTQQPDPNPDGSSTSATRYRECLKNHAASLGGHVVDGCGEFMAAPTDPLKCAACGCHRSFHRRESESESDSINDPIPHRSTANRIPLMLPPPHPNPHYQKTNFSIGFRPPSPLAFGGGGGGNSGGGTTTESSSEEKKEGLGRDEKNNNNNSNEMNDKNSGNKRKRFRTKFSSDQKEKMMGFAERVGWRVQKKDEVEMERFCGEIGVSRQVLKVWMHNNKHLVKRPPQQQQQVEKVESGAPPPPVAQQQPPPPPPQ